MWRKAGRRKARVLPEPVWEMPMVSWPFMSSGHIWAWMGEGRVKPFFLISLIIEAGNGWIRRVVKRSRHTIVTESSLERSERVRNGHLGVFDAGVHPKRKYVLEKLGQNLIVSSFVISFSFRGWEIVLFHLPFFSNSSFLKFLWISRKRHRKRKYLQSRESLQNPKCYY